MTSVTYAAVMTNGLTSGTLAEADNYRSYRVTYAMNTYYTLRLF